jgi:hypothetical protein
MHGMRGAAARVILGAAAMSLLGATPTVPPSPVAGVTPDAPPPGSPIDLKKYDRPLETPHFAIRPPKDPAEYQAVLDKIRNAPTNDLFAFASLGGVKVEENLGKDATLGQASVRLGTLVLPIRPDQAYDLYYRSLSLRGVVITSHPMKNASALAYRERADGFMRSVTLVSQGRSTLVIAAVADPARVLAPSSQSGPPADWPMPPLVSAPMDMESAEGERREKTRYVSVGCHDAGEALTFFELYLPEKGWSSEPGSRSTEANHAREVFRRGDQICDLTIRFGDDSSASKDCALNIVCISRR